MAEAKKGLKVVAMLEASKGVLSLLVSFGLHVLAGENVKHVAESIVRHLHLNPVSELPRLFIQTASSVTSSNVSLFAFLALFYSLVRFIEAYGLWRGFVWIEWFAFLSGAIYLPFEIYEIILNMSSVAIAMFLINIVVVWYIGRTLFNGGKQSEPA